MKKIFVAATFTNKVDYESGQVLDSYKSWLVDTLSLIERAGYETYCSLKIDDFSVNDENPVDAVNRNFDEIKQADGFLALIDEKVSAGVQTEIGAALAWGKPILMAHEPRINLQWINKAILESGKAGKCTLPLTQEKLHKFFE